MYPYIRDFNKLGVKHDLGNGSYVFLDENTGIKYLVMVNREGNNVATLFTETREDIEYWKTLRNEVKIDRLTKLANKLSGRNKTIQ